MAESVESPQNGLKSSCEEIRDLCTNNTSYFKKEVSESGKKFCQIFHNLDQLLDPLKENYEKIETKCHLYDFDSTLKANGYRSFLKMVDIALKKCLKMCQKITTTRSSYFFRKGSIERELDACYQVLASLLSCLVLLKQLMTLSDVGHLFPSNKCGIQELLSSTETPVNQYGFYGRSVGFQFCDSIGIVVKALNTLMASYSEVYYGRTTMLDSLWSGGRYFLDPELRAKRVVNLSQYASADFCKTFWFLGETELMHKLPSFVSPSLAVNKMLSLEPEPISITGEQGIIIHIPPPTAHKGEEPVNVRLLSASRRLGMATESNSKEGLKMKSKYLIVHCHGGGFVAQSSRSHETYLRQWALTADCPIFSIDYSLAPEAPYPRAIEEVFFAYCWALTNAHQLGTTAERIVMAGDSAGANLCIAVTMKCIEFGVRPPHGMFLAYVPILLSIVPSPSRLLCLADPILPFGFVMNCTRAYVSPPEEYLKMRVHEHKLIRKIQKTIPFFNGATSKPENYAFNYIKDILCVAGASIDLDDETKFVDEDIKLEEEIKEEAMMPCPMDMLELDLPDNPYQSPYYIPERILAAFPPVSIVSVDMDPFLDDCIEFAKKLKNAGNDVDLQILSGLCHGFLNFSMLSKEASEGTKICIKLISKLLGMEEVQSPISINKYSPQTP